MIWNSILSIALVGVIYVQRETILSHKRNINILTKKINEITHQTNQNTVERGKKVVDWKPSIIQGDLEMVHEGKRVTIHSIFYPKKIM